MGEEKRRKSASMSIAGAARSSDDLRDVHDEPSTNRPPQYSSLQKMLLRTLHRRCNITEDTVPRRILPTRHKRYRCRMTATMDDESTLRQSSADGDVAA